MHPAIQRALDVSYDRSRSYHERLRVIVFDPEVPRRCLHAFACRMASNSLLYERNLFGGVESSARHAILAKRRWMRGKCSTSEMRTSHDVAFLALVNSTGGPLRAMPLFAASAASVPHAGRSAWLSAWAHSWQYVLFEAQQYGFSLHVAPDYQHALGKLRKDLRAFRLPLTDLDLTDQDEGLRLEQLAALRDDECREHMRTLDVLRSKG